jgi:hypothetical protein
MKSQLKQLLYNLRPDPIAIRAWNHRPTKQIALRARIERETILQLLAPLFERVYSGLLLADIVEVCKALGAIRPICKREESDAWHDDMRALAAAQLSDRLVRDALRASGFSDSKISDWLTEAADEEIGVITRCDTFVDFHEAMYCNYYEEYIHPDEELRAVRTSYGYEDWCSDAIENHAFYCEESDKYYRCNDYENGVTVGGNTICVEWAQDHGWWCNDDGEWTDEEEEDDERIPGYHTAHRQWDYRVANRSMRGWYGIELEVDIPCGNRYQFWHEHLSDSADHCGERDGSLDEETGIEIITRPYTLLELHVDNPLRQLFSAMESYDAEDGSDHYDGRHYGCHITANFYRLNTDHRRRVVDFVFSNRRLVEFVSRREANRYCEFNGHGGKHIAVHERDTYVFEFRTFASTTDYDTLVSYVEFVDAVVEFTRDPMRAIKGVLTGALFRAFVTQRRGDYPALASRFSKKELPLCA